MKIFFLFAVAFFCYSKMFSQSASTITDINNNTVNIDSMAGNKILVVVLPLSQDTAVINQLIRFKTNFSSVTVVGLVCLRNCGASTDSLSSIYADAMAAGVIVTEGVPSTDSTSDQRRGVMQWLSARGQNQAAEISFPGSKFFLSENGKLFANGDYYLSLDDPMVANIVNTIVPGDN